MTAQKQIETQTTAEAAAGRVVPMPGRGGKEAAYIAAAEALIAGRQGAEPANLLAARGRALRAFAAAGFPNRRVEAWKYTDLAAVLSRGDNKAPVAPERQPLFAGVAAHDVTFGDGGAVNGQSAGGFEIVHFNGQKDDPPAWALSLLDALPDDAGWHKRPLAALALASARDVVGLRVKAGEVLSLPLSVVHGKDGADGGATVLLIDVEEGAAATVLEDYATTAFSTHYVLLRLGRNARASHFKTFQGQAEAPVLTLTDIVCGEKSGYRAFYLNLGGGLARNELRVSLNGEDAQADLNGATLLADRDHGDTTVVMDHGVPRCTSSQSFKTVAADRARGVFQGKVIVDRDAQHTDARQVSKALLLSPRAEMDTKPELEIYADDVKCSHGATAGQLDADALFYLRSRGLPPAEASQLLILAFIGELLDQVEDENLATRLRDAAERWLEAKASDFAEDKKTA